MGGELLEISEITMLAPYARLLIAEDGRTNFQELMVDAPASEADAELIDEVPVTTGSGRAPLTIALGRLGIEDGSSDFTDLSLPLPFATRIVGLNGELTTFVTSSAEPAQLSLEGQVAEYGLAQVSGSVHPRGPTQLMDIRLLFRNVAMPDLSPYTARFAGRTIDDGRLELDLRYSIEGGVLNGENDILIADLQLGERVEHPDAMDLPLDMAVALLTGPDGRIDIDLPVSGDLNDPQFRISGIILRAFGNLVTAMVTSPFRLLGRLVGIESENFDQVEFEPGQSELTPPEHEKLIKLAEALTLRPNLSLNVLGVAAVDADTAALKKARVDDQIDAGTEALSAEGETTLMVRRRQVLEPLYSSRLPDQSADLMQAEFMRAGDSSDAESPLVLDETAYLAALLEKLIGAEPVSESDLDELAASRASEVMLALTATGQVSPDRILTGPREAASLNDAGWIPMSLDLGRAAAGL